jgi:hypothetical protein
MEGRVGTRTREVTVEEREEKRRLFHRMSTLAEMLLENNDKDIGE